MDVYRIVGGRRICGTARVGAAKNAVLPILAAALLTDDRVTLLDCPHIADVENMIAILKTLGCKCSWEGNELTMAEGTEWDGTVRLVWDGKPLN